MIEIWSATSCSQSRCVCTDSCLNPDNRRSYPPWQNLLLLDGPGWYRLAPARCRRQHVKPCSTPHILFCNLNLMVLVDVFWHYFYFSVAVFSCRVAGDNQRHRTSVPINCFRVSLAEFLIFSVVLIFIIPQCIIIRSWIHLCLHISM
jgi:hypothetical protein